jgi:hypothetical protein
MAGRLLQIGEREIPFGIRYVPDLIKPRNRVSNMGCVGHRLFASAWKRESRGWKQIFLGRGHSAMRGLAAVRFPCGFGHSFIFLGGFWCWENEMA